MINFTTPSTTITHNDLVECIKDDFGIIYSKDGSRLLDAKHIDVNIESYPILAGTKVICDHAFHHCKSISEIHIPDTIISIGQSAFSCCYDLKTINFPNSVISIGDNAFSWCKNLNKIVIPQSVINIGLNAFIGCGKEIIDVSPMNTIYDSRDSCNAIVESKCNKIVVGGKHTIIPNSITEIGDNAFKSCKGLTTIQIPDSVTIIGNNAFEECYDLSAINIPNSISSIGDYAFSRCKSLQKIIIPDTITSIGDYAFNNCSNLSEVFFPDTIASIGINVFYMCHKKTLANLKKTEYGYKIVNRIKLSRVSAIQEWFSQCEKATVEYHDVEWRKSKCICFQDKNGNKHYEILSPLSSLNIGDEVDIQTIEFLHFKKMGTDMLRVDGVKIT